MAAQSETIIGFAVLERKSAAVMEILWLAMLPDEQGAGTGSALVEMVAADARRSGVAGVCRAIGLAEWLDEQDTTSRIRRAGYDEQDTTSHERVSVGTEIVVPLRDAALRSPCAGA